MTGASWKLAPDIAPDVQALVVSGSSELPAGCALLLSAERTGGAWIAALRKVAPISAADGKQAPSVALAFTSAGLAQIGLGATRLEFAQPFVEGMMQADRRRRLGDLPWKGSLAPKIEWGLPADGDTQATAAPVHALLLVYDADHDALLGHEARLKPVLEAAGVRAVRRIALDLRLDGTQAREHFGFVDGISQPIPYGAGTSDGNGGPYPRDPLHGVKLGEILLGHPDAHEHTSEGPFMVGALGAKGAFTPSSAKPENTKPENTKSDNTKSDDAAVTAMQDPTAETLRDLGRNGTYLVVRELRQDVDGFKASLGKAAADLNARDPHAPPVDGDWLAERVMGRTRNGDMLRPGDTTLPPGSDGLPENDFLYFLEDRYGRGCPIGSHVRRANPRDGLAYREEVCADLLGSANAHRILRRGRKFGGDVAEKAAVAAKSVAAKSIAAKSIAAASETGSTESAATESAVATPGPTDEGLLFICLNGDISRQFEFVQQNWMLNPNFATLFDEVDPLVGPAGKMTLPDTPLRRRVDVATYITLVGGDYFFLPSLTALDVFEALPGETP